MYIRVRPERTTSPTGGKGKKFEPTCISELDLREPHHPLVVKVRGMNLYQGKTKQTTLLVTINAVCILLPCFVMVTLRKASHCLIASVVEINCLLK